MAHIIKFKESPLCLIDLIHEQVIYATTYEGLINEIEKVIQEFKKEVTGERFIDGKKLTAEALGRVGQEFKPGQTEQCCYFVRDCLKSAGITAGITAKASDGMQTSEGYASSLAGDDIGFKISEIKDLFPGDLVFFKNTYGTWPEGTITHIGIYIGSGYFVHRPTASRPVEKAYLESYGHFREGRRIYV